MNKFSTNLIFFDIFYMTIKYKKIIFLNTFQQSNIILITTRTIMCLPHL